MKLRYIVTLMIFISIIYYSIPFSVSAQESDDALPPPVIDGVIDDDEYEFSVSLGTNDFELHWQIVNESISIGMRAKTDGWIALGIDPTSVMKDADMFVGWVEPDGTVRLLDCYATGKTGPHPADTELGGTSDLDAFNGSYDGEWTTFELTRKLKTGDEYDNDINIEGDTKVLWAYGGTDNHDVKHSQRGGVVIDFSTGEASEYIPWYFHAAWMTAGFILILAGIIIVKFFKTKPWRIKVHRVMLLLGGASSIFGLGSGIFMVTINGSGHFDIPHAFIGLFTIVLILSTIWLGFHQFKCKPDKMKKIKSMHRWFGRITATLMIINMMIGFSYVGVF